MAASAWAGKRRNAVSSGYSISCERLVVMTLPKDITQLLEDWSNGDPVALDKLMPLVYDELRHIASRHLRRCRPDNIIQTTVLVHEAFLRLVDQKNVSFQNRVHFFAVASKAIR